MNKIALTLLAVISTLPVIAVAFVKAGQAAQHFKLKRLSFFILAMLGFALTTPSASLADSVTALANAAVPTSCDVVAPSTASCSSTGAAGTASAFADLASGTLTASINSTSLGASASATLSANISLVLPQGYSASDVPVTLTFDPSYNISGNASIFDENIFPVADSNSTFGEVCSGTVTCTLGPLDLSLTYNVPLTSLTNILINAQVQVDSPNGAIASIDPGIGLILPTGVTFTSESGEFLTQTATPLPATLPLFATGLGTLGLLGWRRKREARASLLGVA